MTNLEDPLYYNELSLNIRVLFVLLIKFTVQTGRTACSLYVVLSWEFSNLKGEMKGMNSEFTVNCTRKYVQTSQIIPSFCDI